MKTIATIAAIAALTTLAACEKTEAPAEVTTTEAATEVPVDKQKNPDEQIP